MPESSPSPADLAGWLAYLESLHPKSIALGLERVGEVADRMGLNLRMPIITVGGTNGKGSTCAMLESIYQAAGYRTACYTSPHLLRYNERVRVNAMEVEDAALCTAFRAVEAVRAGTPLTYFEFGTLAAMWHFMQAGVQVAILEVGLGGRLDAVNLFDPWCAIVTSIDLDHMDYLGHTRTSIGREKAGIFRAGVPAICGDDAPPDSIAAVARQVGADLRCVGVDFCWTERGQGWNFHSAGVQWTDLPRPALNGLFQMGNAACAMEAVAALQARVPVPEQAVRAGLRQASLEGRFQVCATHPQIILDVAHNPHAARGLAQNLARTPCKGRTLAVFAMLADKDMAGVARALAEVVDVWYLAGIRAPRGSSADLLAGQLLSAAPQARVFCCDQPAAAFRQACLSAAENDRIAAFGSFYTVADVLRALPAISGKQTGPSSSGPAR